MLMLWKCLRASAKFGSIWTWAVSSLTLDNLDFQGPVHHSSCTRNAIDYIGMFLMCKECKTVPLVEMERNAPTTKKEDGSYQCACHQVTTGGAFIKILYISQNSTDLNQKWILGFNQLRSTVRAQNYPVEKEGLVTMSKNCQGFIFLRREFLNLSRPIVWHIRKVKITILFFSVQHYCLFHYSNLVSLACLHFVHASKTSWNVFSVDSQVQTIWNPALTCIASSSCMALYLHSNCQVR